MIGTRGGSCPRRRSWIVAGWMGLLIPSSLAAQVPGGPPADMDLDRATFRAAMLERIRPLMDSWQAAWRGQGDASVESHYVADAVLNPPGGPAVGGREEIAEFARSARRGIASLDISMLDFEPADELAYVYGTWEAVPAAGGPAASGRLVTLVRKDKGRWLIRSQLIVADAPGVALLSWKGAPPALPPLADRILPASATGTRTRGARAQARQPPELRRSTYLAVLSALAALRRAWNAGDVGAVTALMCDDAGLQLPGRAGSVGLLTPGDLGQELPAYGSLSTAELDFDEGGTLAYLSGRYYVERTSGPAASGTYVAVFRREGSDWLIRSLVFS